MTREADWIEFLRRRFPAGAGVRVGIGDDAAVLRGPGGSDLVITTDLLIEGQHFLRRLHPPRAVGWKALARSLSDCAAMGARPRWALVALAFPASTPAKWVKEFFEGVGLLARLSGVAVAGGDLSVAKQIVADVQVIGTVPPGRALLRSGARPGDLIFVSGTLGAAGLWLAILRRRLIALEDVAIRAYRASCLPEPRLALGRKIVSRARPTAMIDISDGLSTDLNHICEASRVGARLYQDRIPAVDIPAPLARRLRTTGLQLALNAGEDYELLFTLPKARAQRLPRMLAGIKLTPIGEITRDRRVVLVDGKGRARPLPPRGWDPFRAKR
ncbi:MAG: thiamine-phosphate kinase [Candidatus Acidiferrales bacterium]